MASTIHDYPGVNPLQLRYLRQAGRAGVDYYRCGSFEGVNGTFSDLIQVREVAMMLLMDRLTDEPNWREKAFDDAIVAKWRDEALTQDETALYQEIVAGKPIPKPQRTRIMTEDAFDSCIEELKCKAAHFRETGLVFTLDSTQGSHRPRFACFNTAIKADGLVSSEIQQGLKRAFEKLIADQGAEPDWHPGSNDMILDLLVGVADAVDRWAGKGEPLQPLLDDDEAELEDDEKIRRTRGHNIRREYWSEKYQWLPANLAFRDDGTVRFTSYINNLHPNKHPEIYRLIEQLVDTAIPVWERVLSGRAVTASGGLPVRLDSPLPVYTEEDEEGVWEEYNPDVLAKYEKEHGSIEYHDEDTDDLDEQVEPWDEEAMLRRIQKLKCTQIRDPLLLGVWGFEPVTYKIEGQMNECIVATALYYRDSENVTPSRLSFRMMTDSTQAELEDQVGPNLYKAYERIYGTRLGGHEEGRETVQTHGSQFDWWTEAFFGTEAKALGDIPREVFQLLLERGDGRCVTSSEELLLQNGMKSRLPAEVMDMVPGQVAPDGLMTAERARRHRLALMEERSAFATTAREEEWANRYFF
ncbi:hypothetical protein VTG60DRAFT_4603 [Thermothelomyces hinnuleus]